MQISTDSELWEEAAEPTLKEDIAEFLRHQPDQAFAAKTISDQVGWTVFEGDEGPFGIDDREGPEWTAAAVGRSISRISELCTVIERLHELTEEGVVEKRRVALEVDPDTSERCEEATFWSINQS